LHFTDYYLKHNHPVSQEIYNTYNEVKARKLKQPGAIELATTLLALKTTTYETMSALNNNFHIGLTSKDIQNLRQVTILKAYKNKDQADLLWDEIQKIIDSDPASFNQTKR
jgi:adenylosuccinate lyase